MDNWSTAYKAGILNDIAALRQRVAELTAALETVEWDVDGYCLWCEEYMTNGHASDCQRQAALKEG